MVFCTDTKKRKSKIVRGDNVIIRSGSDKGKVGRVLAVLYSPKGIKVQVDGCGVYSTTKVSKNMDGKFNRQTIEKNRPIDISNVAFFHKESSSWGKIGYRFLEKNKVRFLKKNGKDIESRSSYNA